MQLLWNSSIFFWWTGPSIRKTGYSMLDWETGILKRVALYFQPLSNMFFMKRNRSSWNASSRRFERQRYSFWEYSHSMGATCLSDTPSGAVSALQPWKRVRRRHSVVSVQLTMWMRVTSSSTWTRSWPKLCRMAWVIPPRLFPPGEKFKLLFETCYDILIDTIVFGWDWDQLSTEYDHLLWFR